MALYSDDKKQEIRDRIRLEDLVRDYNILLQPAGSHRLRGLCPFHAEKTPSFYINTDGQFFHCFGCKAGGDLFTFMQKVENVGFSDALEMLARRAGVILEPVRAGERSSASKKSSLYEALSLAEEYYHALLCSDPRAEPARHYLRSRGITDDIWKRFRLGYSLPEWDGFLRFALGKGQSQEVLERAGLVRESQRASAGPASGPGAERRLYDYFRGRLMFPIADGQKRIVGFGARTLGDEQPKYLNTPKTAVFDKSHVLYGLPLARAAIDREKRIAIVEGYTDVIAAHQAGLEHFVASLGTAFTQENAGRLRRLAPRVDLVFDGDFAGQSAAERSLALLVSKDLDVRVLTLEAGEDPFDVLQQLGGPKFRERLERDAVGIFEFKWRRTVGALHPEDRSAGDTARAFDEVLDLLLMVPNVIARKLHAGEFAEKLGIPAEDIERRLKKKSANIRGRSAVELSGSRARDMRSGGVSNVASNGGLSGADWNGRGDAHALGAPTRSAASADNPGLEEVILETLLAEPDRAASRWREIPEFQFNATDLSPAIKSIALAIGKQLEHGELNVERLVGLLDTQEASTVLAQILGRLEQQSLYDDSKIWNRTESIDESWSRCMREVERQTLLKRRQELNELKARARAAGDSESLLAAEREYRELLRSMANARPPSG